MIIDLESWEEGYSDGLVGRPLDAPPVSTASRIRAAIRRLARIVTAHEKAFGARLGCQLSEPLNHAVVALE
jgi:hypothetical protein